LYRTLLFARGMSWSSSFKRASCEMDERWMRSHCNVEAGVEGSDEFVYDAVS
jgi:hypothetical protein